MSIDYRYIDSAVQTRAEMNENAINESARVKILFFAKARELSGFKESEVTVPIVISFTELKARVIKNFNLESIRDIVILAVNEEFVEPDTCLKLTEKDEIAVIPPLSGGKFFFWITYYITGSDKMENEKDFVALESKKLHINDIIETVVSSNCGALSTFIGTTRDNFEQKKVVKLEYEAYESMAIKEMRAICNKVRSQWDVEKIAIYHRLGEVPVMEVSIVIAISSAHREESLQAVQYAINAVKSSVPIWKKEIYENNEPQWKENKECFWITNGTKINSKKIDEIKENSITTEINNTNIVDSIEIDLDNVYETVEINSEYINESSDDEYNDINKEYIINPDHIQIKAGAEELNRRIESFISRKREQVNMVNIQGFCTYSNQIANANNDNASACARVNAVLIRRKDSKSHVKVHRVYNQWSHQNIKLNVPIVLGNKSYNYSSAVEERFSTAEKILGINKPIPQDVYKRMKKIEDRLLFLESISPEYKDLWATDDCDSIKSFNSNCNNDYKLNTNINNNSIRKRTYSTTELDLKLHELENKYVKIAK